MSRSLEELRAAGVASPELREAIEKQPMPAFPETDLVAYREARAAHLRTLRHLMPVPGPVPQVHEATFAVETPDGPVRVVLYRPAAATPDDRRPLVVLYHEGAWFAGDTSDEEFNARLLARDLGVVCLNVEYRLAPEHPFPAGISDCRAVLRWAAASAASINADPRLGFIVGGSSAGGNIAAVLALVSRDEGLDPPVTGQWLSVPFLTPIAQVPERYRGAFLSPFENKSDPVLRSLDVEAERACLQMLQADIDSPLFSPLAPAHYPPRRGAVPLARAFFQIAGLDPLRDHGLVYDRILREEHGVDTKVELYPGFGHMFWTNWPALPTSRRFSEDMLRGFAWLLDVPSTQADGVDAQR